MPVTVVFDVQQLSKVYRIGEVEVHALRDAMAISALNRKLLRDLLGMKVRAAAMPWSSRRAAARLRCKSGGRPEA